MTSTAAFGSFGVTTAGSRLSYFADQPNIYNISDPNVIVCFRNISKKDGTTKSKALEDLRTYVQAHPYELDGGPEERILEAWVRLILHRLSICTSN